MESQLKELLPFLHERNPQARRLALSNLLGHTPKDSPFRSIFFTGLGGGGINKETDNDCIRDLKLLCRDQLAIAYDAFRALVNLSDSALLNASLSEPSFLKFLVSYILSPPSILADLASMILSNISNQTSTCAALIALKVPVLQTPGSTSPFYPPLSRAATSPPPSPYPSGDTVEVEALPLLVQAFVQGAEVGGEKKREGNLHFLATVFANISTAPAGRLVFLTPRPRNPLLNEGDLEYLLAQLTVFTEHSDTIRRGGVASTIKHCAFHVPAHKAILLSESESTSVPPSELIAPGINALPNILLPLAGPEEFDLEDQEKLPAALQLLPETKKREPDSVLRIMYIETLVLLCTTRAGREHLRNNGVYEIVRAAHLVETVDEVSQEMERLVTLLKGDEAPIRDLEDDGWNHPLLNGASDGGPKTGNTSMAESEQTSAPVGSLIDEEDEDDRIVEV